MIVVMLGGVLISAVQADNPPPWEVEDDYELDDWSYSWDDGDRKLRPPMAHTNQDHTNQDDDWKKSMTIPGDFANEIFSPGKFDDPLPTSLFGNPNVVTTVMDPLDLGGPIEALPMMPPTETWNVAWPGSRPSGEPGPVATSPIAFNGSSVPAPGLAPLLVLAGFMTTGRRRR